MALHASLLWVHSLHRLPIHGLMSVTMGGCHALVPLDHASRQSIQVRALSGVHENDFSLSSHDGCRGVSEILWSGENCPDHLHSNFSGVNTLDEFLSQQTEALLLNRPCCRKQGLFDSTVLLDGLQPGLYVCVELELADLGLLGWGKHGGDMVFPKPPEVCTVLKGICPLPYDCSPLLGNPLEG